MGETSPKSVGLGGDGDEIAAIADVEDAFGVKLDYTDGLRWRTAGDVFSSLQKALPAEERNEADLWIRFVVALSAGTGVDPNSIEPDSPLLSDSRLWSQIANASAMVWAIILASALLLIAVAML